MRAAAWLAAAGLALGSGSVALAGPRGGSAAAPAERDDTRGAARAERSASGGADNASRGNDRGERRRNERRERLKQRIRAMRAFRLTEALALDEATAGRLFPLLSRYDDETDKLLEKRLDMQRRLQRASSMQDPRVIDRLIDEAVVTQRAIREAEDRRLGELRKLLTPLQVARLLVVLPALERKIENQLRKAIVRGPAERGDRDEDEDEGEGDEPAAPPLRPRAKIRPTTP